MYRQQQYDTIATEALLNDYYYRVRLPYLQSRTDAEMKHYGTVVSGIREIDNDIQNQWINSSITIRQMIDYYKRGVQIRVVSDADVKTIYDQISQHIHAWKFKLQRGINIGDAPIDDLISMDEFAAITYGHAKYQFTREIANSFLGQAMTSVQRINASNLFSNNKLMELNRPPDQARVVHEAGGITRINSDDEFEERESLGEFFKTRIINYSRFNNG